MLEKTLIILFSSLWISQSSSQQSNITRHVKIRSECLGGTELFQEPESDSGGVSRKCTVKGVSDHSRGGLECYFFIVW